MTSSATRHPYPAQAAQAVRTAHPLTVAGALLLAASELTYLSGRAARGESMPPNLSALLARYARCCTEGAAELRDPLVHHPCCRAANRERIRD